MPLTPGISLPRWLDPCLVVFDEHPWALNNHLDKCQCEKSLGDGVKADDCDSQPQEHLPALCSCGQPVFGCQSSTVGAKPRSRAEHRVDKNMRHPVLPIHAF